MNLRQPSESKYEAFEKNLIPGQMIPELNMRKCLTMSRDAQAYRARMARAVSVTIGHSK